MTAHYKNVEYGSTQRSFYLVSKRQNFNAMSLCFMLKILLQPYLVISFLLPDTVVSANKLIINDKIQIKIPVPNVLLVSNFLQINNVYLNI